MKRKEITENIINSIFALRRAFSSELHFIVNEIHITYTQWLVLSAVKHNKNISIKDLGGILGITSSAATQIVDGLVKKEILVRKRNPRDRRYIKLDLSEKSKAHFKNIKVNHIKAFMSLFNVLDDNEILKYEELTQKVAENALCEMRDEKKQEICSD